MGAARQGDHLELWSAELSKLTQNAFLAQRVSSINAISALCEATGADVDEVSFAVGVDTRIGRKGMTASVGFGGACYETHLRNLVYLASVSRLPQVAKYWQAVINMNEWQKRRFATKVVSAMFNTVSGKKLALLGFAYKKNTSDTRNSAAIDVCRALLTERAQIAVHDPRVAKEAIAVALSDADGAERCSPSRPTGVAIDGSRALVTEWDEFKQLDYKRAFSMMQKPPSSSTAATSRPRRPPRDRLHRPRHRQGAAEGARPQAAHRRRQHRRVLPGGAEAGGGGEAGGAVEDGYHGWRGVRPGRRCC